MQLPTPPEVREWCHSEIQAGLEMMNHIVQDCLEMLDHSPFMLTSL